MFGSKLVLPKTSHWELFGGRLLNPVVCENFFSCKKFSHFQKCAFTDKEFRSLRRATKGSAFRIRELFEKSSIKNICFSSCYPSLRRRRNSVQLQAGYLPVEPKPPSPRSVSESSVTSSISGSSTGIITICATLSCG